MRQKQASVSPDDTPVLVPEIALHHGQALWLLSELGFQGDAAQSTFYEYIKSLRKLGIPFEAGKIGMARRGLANYSYHHLMELALALTLRVYHVVPDSVLISIIEHRESLNRQYQKAYSERCTGKGALVVFETEGFPPIQVRGVFLDLQLRRRRKISESTGAGGDRLWKVGGDSLFRRRSLSRGHD